MSQGDVPIDPDATRIRTAAGHCFRHRSDEVLVRPEIAILANPASYSADRVILRVRFPCQHAAYPVQRVNFLDQRRSARGQKAKYSPRVNVFRFSPNIRRCSACFTVQSTISGPTSSNHFLGAVARPQQSSPPNGPEHRNRAAYINWIWEMTSRRSKRSGGDVPLATLCVRRWPCSSFFVPSNSLEGIASKRLSELRVSRLDRSHKICSQPRRNSAQKVSEHCRLKLR